MTHVNTCGTLQGAARNIADPTAGMFRLLVSLVSSTEVCKTPF